MSDICLEVLNANRDLELQYLPFGATTVEMRIKDPTDAAIGFIFPGRKARVQDKLYFGYAGEGEDFQVLWGGGKEKGLEVTKKNMNGRLFLQIFHLGKSLSDDQNLMLYHESQTGAVANIKLVPAFKDENIAKIRFNPEKPENERCKLSFDGNVIPTYYSRWFPPHPSLGKTTIPYVALKDLPSIEISFMAKATERSTFASSDIEICVNGKKIAEVTGDWIYSWPHAEIFTVFGRNDFLVLRLWLRWTNGNFSKKKLRGGEALLADSPGSTTKTRRGLWESFDIECPDFERFDFLINVEDKSVIWVGTDFHYQEYWNKVNEHSEFAKARIANDVETLAEVFKNIHERIKPPIDFDPMEELKKQLLGNNGQTIDFEEVNEPGEFVVSNIDSNGKTTRALGFTRKHIPFIRNSKFGCQLASSVVTA